jgi:hypothetical protein
MMKRWWMNGAGLLVAHNTAPNSFAGRLARLSEPGNSRAKLTHEATGWPARAHLDTTTIMGR